MIATAATARANSDNVPEVDKILTLRNYGKWKIYMKNVLVSKYLWTVVDGSETRDQAPQFYEIKSNNAMAVIRISCGEEMFKFIDKEYDSASVWLKLKGKLEAVSAERVTSATPTLNAGELLRVRLDEQTSTISSNYETWKAHMENYLKDQGLWDFLEKPTVLSDCVKDEKALDAIKLSCTFEIRAYILYMNCAKDAWEKLATVAVSPGIGGKKFDQQLYTLRSEANINLQVDSEAGKVLTRSNYHRWIKYVEKLLSSRFLSEVLIQIDHVSHRRILIDYEIRELIIKKACGIRIIKEACGPGMMPYIFRSKSPRKALDRLRNACSMHQNDDFMKYSRLLHAVQKNMYKDVASDQTYLSNKTDDLEPWRGGRKFFRDFPESIIAEITKDGSTALHVAVRLEKINFVKEMLTWMPVKFLELKTHQGNTPLAVAAGGTEMKIVKMLVDKNPDLLLISNDHELHPVTIAAINGNEKIMRYLYPRTCENIQLWAPRSVASLLTSATRLDAFDIVEKLLSQFPDYALVQDDDGITLLSVLADKPSAFPSGNQFGLFGGWIYGLAVPGIKQVLDSKEKNDLTAVILRDICSLLLDLNPHQLKESFINDAIYLSIIHGTVEVFKILIDSNPYVEDFKEENGRGLFQISIINRQKNIFQFMSEMGRRNHDMTLLDHFGNNALHCAALWDPSRKQVHGPALEMQREIQWFQEVERVVPPRYKKMKNYTDQMLTPQALFSSEHQVLAKEAKEWMKEMASACILVTALIATVMFAAPFTLPGGTHQDTGVSLTLKSRAFRVFIVSDVISLFASCTSLMMFFSILTARFAERDFLTSLPRRLILGLFTLFISISSMMATFTATVVIVLREDVGFRAYIWVSILACIPVVVFAFLQLRLFGNLVLSTYGRDIFRWYFLLFLVAALSGTTMYFVLPCSLRLNFVLIVMCPLLTIFVVGLRVTFWYWVWVFVTYWLLNGYFG
ncbi:hypothetical protein MKX03_003433 [Papaver bracteatum]|nr:hypothetical protein MKX03_003433 [Papaver bracteatum]